MIEELWGTALALNYLANGWYIVGAYSEAQRCAHEALEIATKARLVPLALEALVTLAAVRIQNAEKETARVLLQLALQHSASTHMTKKRAQDLLVELEPYLLPDLISGYAQDIPRFEEIVAKELKS